IKVEPMNGDPNEHTNLRIDHSLVKDGIDGILPFPVPGNTIDFLPSSIDADPLFTGGFDIHDPLFYSLSEYSPCIDAGTPDTSELNLPPFDLAGNWRIWNDRIDMGAFEYGSRPWVSIDDPVVPAIDSYSIHAYPNPFSTYTNIRILLEAYAGKNCIATASLKIYNLKGQLVKKIPVRPMTDEQVLNWDTRDADGRLCGNGIYLLRLECDGMPLETKKISLIK
ncbi:MAG: T9SS type A sorting domain-containing protein, partial [Candidatus Cloacimonetes bacterium]|nr:T9SS type A sorting domain-containing protein [Candidatus Cloacimonadota bacterium]